MKRHYAHGDIVERLDTNNPNAIVGMAYCDRCDGFFAKKHFAGDHRRGKRALIGYVPRGCFRPDDARNILTAQRSNDEKAA